MASLTPCLRYRSATETPASCSFKIPMICSVRKAAALHALVLAVGQNELQTGLSPRGKVTSAAVMLARVDWSNCSIEIMLPPLAMERGLRDDVCHHGGCSGRSPVMTPRI